jgi:serine/alanine adding enzyme
MRFKVITLESPEWGAAIAALPSHLRDIHFLPEYAKIYALTYGYVPFLALLRGPDGFVVQSFMRRDLRSLSFMSNRASDLPYFDIVNPYGYGGPVCSALDERIAADMLDVFEREFYAYCEGQHYASEFASLHPLLENHKPLQHNVRVELQQQKSVVYIPLEEGAEGIWSGMRRGHQCAIRQAQRLGVTGRRVDANDENIEILKNLYSSTMERVGAAERWNFPSDYFLNCFNCLGGQRSSLFFSFLGDQVIGACILIHDFETIYYHFGGTDHRYHSEKPGFVMLHEAALWGARQEYKFFHLGGGVTGEPDDSLLKFKKGFSKKTAALYSYARVLHAPTYDTLCELKRSYEIQQQGHASDSTYFPLYRR